MGDCASVRELESFTEKNRDKGARKGARKFFPFKRHRETGC